MYVKVGCEWEGLTVGPFGLGKRNEHGDCMVEYTQTDIYQHLAWMHQTRLYTWKSPNSDIKNQINYIFVPECFINVVQKVKTYPGADSCTDHNLVIMNIAMKLKWLQKFKREPKKNQEELKIPARAQWYTVKIEKRFPVLEEDWEALTTTYK